MISFGMFFKTKAIVQIMPLHFHKVILISEISIPSMILTLLAVVHWHFTIGKSTVKRLQEEV